MTDLQEFSNDQDKYIYSIIEKLREKYSNVEALRRSNRVIFICDSRRSEISKLQLMGCFMAGDIEDVIKCLQL